ncbi:hypothetical protein CKO27_09335 [Thiocystis violacea]|nr:hypothetical protein [Thiocystis violacea]
MLALADVSAGTGEPVLARVLSVEADRVTLSVEDRADGEDERVSILVDRAELPPGIEPGRLVRLWPGPGSGARLVPLDQGLAEPDRTGVRARLMHGAERGFGRRGGR